MIARLPASRPAELVKGQVNLIVVDGFMSARPTRALAYLGIESSFTSETGNAVIQFSIAFVDALNKTHRTGGIPSRALPHPEVRSSRSINARWRSWGAVSLLVQPMGRAPPSNSRGVSRPPFSILSSAGPTPPPAEDRHAPGSAQTSR